MAEKIIMLGTGNALVTHIYNTCFVLTDGQTPLLVDAGGGNGVMAQMERAGVDFADIHDVFVTHAHTDHIMGVIWVIRFFVQRRKKGLCHGTLHIWSHDEPIRILNYCAENMLGEKLFRQMNDCVTFHRLGDGESFSVGDMRLTAFDIHSTKKPQFGFLALMPSGKRVVCLGDEPYCPANKPLAENADWLMQEAFCKYADRDIYKPYEKHHSTVTDAARLATELHASNLILYHTEEDSIATRRQDYTAEARAHFQGNVYVPDDCESIDL